MFPSGLSFFPFPSLFPPFFAILTFSHVLFPFTLSCDCYIALMYDTLARQTPELRASILRYDVSEKAKPCCGSVLEDCIRDLSLLPHQHCARCNPRPGFVRCAAPATFHAPMRAVRHAVPARQCGMAVMRMLFTVRTGLDYLPSVLSHIDLSSLNSLDLRTVRRNMSNVYNFGMEGEVDDMTKW